MIGGKDMIEDNGTICAAPWVHLYINPNGNMHPCCTAWDTKFGNVNEQSLGDVWNSDNAKKFRKEIKQGIKQRACNFCYTQEEYGETSLRQNLNKRYDHYISDDHVALDHIKYIDIRSSNICNQACVMCNHDLSSKWYEDTKALFPNDIEQTNKTKFINISDDAKTSVLGIINEGLEDIYFAGGEPLLTPFHYDVLNELISKGYAKNVRLRYNTNLSTLNYKNVDIFDLWKHFNDVEIAASIDAVGDRAEYIRYGCNWNDVKNNWKALVAKNITVIPQITVTAFSIGYLPELIDEIENELNFTGGHICYNLSLGPLHTSAQNLPTEVKYLYRDKLLQKLQKGTRHDIYNNILDNSIKFMWSVDTDKVQLDLMIQVLDRLDQRRNTDWRKLYPEIAESVV